MPVHSLCEAELSELQERTSLMFVLSGNGGKNNLGARMRAGVNVSSIAEPHRTQVPITRRLPGPPSIPLPWLASSLGQLHAATN